MDRPRILISVLNWNNFKDTIECIYSITEQNWDNTNIIIIDNNSKDESVQIIKKKFPIVPIIELNENEGYAGGHKHAADYAFNNNFDILWILNNDTLVEQDTLPQLIRAYYIHSNSVLGSIILFQDNGIIEFGGGRELLPDGGINRNIRDNQFENCYLEELKNEICERKVSYVHGASIFIPLKIIQKYGFLDTSFFLYCEEMDYCYRLRKRGINSIIVPASKVFHKGRQSTKLNNKLHWVAEYYLYRNFQFFYTTYENKTKTEILSEYGGLFKFHIKLAKSYFWKLIIFFITKSHKKKTISFNKIKYYYRLLGIYHFIKGIKGKTIWPEKFLK